MRTITDRWTRCCLAALPWLLLGAGCTREPDEGPGGLWTAVTVPIDAPAHARVDIAVLIDNSYGTLEGNGEFTTRFPALIDALVNPPADPATGEPAHLPVEDINIGVVDIDMGTMGYTVPTCANPNGGDRGCFQHAPSPAVGGCAASYPRFLSRNNDNAAVYDAATMAHDFTCIGTLPEPACGFEQPLKSMREALTTDMLPGGCNEGFLRDDAVLALLFETDEDDSSVDPAHPEMFDQSADLGNLNVRCYLHPEFLVPVEDYLAAFRALKPPDRQDDIVVGMIVGVPQTAPLCIGSGDMLNHCLDGTVPQMLGGLDPSDSSRLAPVCTSELGASGSVAYPGVRMVSLARLFGANAYVDSFCKGDWTGAIEGITSKIVERLPPLHTCMSHDLEFDAAACLVNCLLVETLSDDRVCAEDPSCPSAGCPAVSIAALEATGVFTDLPPCTNPDTGANCEPLKRDLGLLDSGGVSHRRCLVRQAARTAAGGSCTAPVEDGWWYVPSAESTQDPPCAEVRTASGGPAAARLLEDGSAAELQCLVRNCPAERQCGPVSDPLATCCAEGATCTPDPAGGAGSCS